MYPNMSMSKNYNMICKTEAISIKMERETLKHAVNDHNTNKRTQRIHNHKMKQLYLHDHNRLLLRTCPMMDMYLLYRL